jgi:hypothetical protein
MSSTRGSVEYGTVKYHVLHHRPAMGREDENVESMLAREFHKLVCLGRRRFGFEGFLPAQLESVRVILRGLEGFAALSN